MKKIALLLSLLLVCSLLAACNTNTPSTPGGNDTPSTPSGNDKPSTPSGSDKPSTPSGSTPSKDWIALSTLSAAATIDPASTTNLNDMVWLNQVYEPLYQYNERTKDFEPRVAESYTVSDDNTVYTFTLRSNAKFHNGDKVDAENIKFALEHGKSTPQKGQYASAIKEVNVVDELTVEIVLTGPSAPFMLNLSNLPIMSKREADEDGEKFGTIHTLAGTGPYYISDEGFDLSTSWILRAFPDYYRGEAKIKEIRYSVIAETTTANVAFEAGELDWLTTSTAGYQDMESRGQFKQELVPANHITFITINPRGNDALADVRIRKGMAYAIDKEIVNLAAMDGIGNITDYLINPDFNVAAPTNIPVYNYDADEAVRLRTEAGYPDKVDIGDIMVSSGSHFGKAVVAVDSLWNELGYASTIAYGESSQNLIRLRAQDYRIGCSGTSISGDASYMDRYFLSDNVGAYYQDWPTLDDWDHEKMDGLLQAANVESDSAKRLGLYEEAYTMLMDYCVWIPLYNKVQPYIWQQHLEVVNYPNWFFVYEWEIVS